jgi:outer membrane receptor for ferrienterochelin and colicins
VINFYRLYIVFILLSLSISSSAQKGWKLDGLVVDSNQRPVANVNLHLSPNSRSVSTDNKGYFVFENLKPGEYKIAVSLQGFERLTDSVEIKRNNLKKTYILTPSLSAIDEVKVEGKIPSVDNLIDVSRAAMPVKTVSKREIELMGSRRLDEVLKEQTGVAIINDMASGSRAVGVQIQGFNSNYVIVLVDGQPMLGRNSGNFDLSRISVTNIERIEIIKGASSSLYGSDALGGAINIITRQRTSTPQLQASLLYGTLNTVDATLEVESPYHNKKGSIVLSGNYYRTDGFNTDKEFLSSKSTTFPPYDNYSFQGRTRYKINSKGTFGATGRLAYRTSTMQTSWAEENTLKDKQEDYDLNLSANYDHQINASLRSMTRYYYSRFQNQMNVEWMSQGVMAGQEEFGQRVHRIEEQMSYRVNQGLDFIGGIGASFEIMDNQDLDASRSLNSIFGYLQSQWKPIEPLKTTLGLRYDNSNLYQGQLSPSFGMEYNLAPGLIAKAGVGAGFKAPDYKMLYQVFYNPAADYLIIGANRVHEILDQMEENREISSRNLYMINLVADNLKAETSISSNAGLHWDPNPNIHVELTAFYHRINNQINTISVANGTEISQIYSYRNLPKAMNRGFETSFSYSIKRNLHVSLGYQFLEAKDLSVLDSIAAGKFPYNQINNPYTSEFRQSRKSDYWGIEDRSRHMFNIKGSYEYEPWQLNLNVRASIRGKYPFQEINGNQFIDQYDAFVPAHTLLNFTLEKPFFNKQLTFRFMVDNAMGFTHRYMLGQPGRMYLAGLSYRWIKNEK